MILKIDYREKERINPIKRYIKNGNSVTLTDAEVVTLEVGDYAIDDVIGIEYKKDDFLDSVYSGLLGKQLHELVEAYDYPFLLIGFDGIQDMINYFSSTNPKVIIGSLTSLAVRHHVTILFCGDFLGKFIVDLADKHYDGKNKAKQTNYTPIRTKRTKAHKRIVSPKEVKVDIISRLYGIGSERAVKLLNRFDWSVKGIAEANTEDLMEISGIGKKLASNIKEGLS